MTIEMMIQPPEIIFEKMKQEMENPYAFSAALINAEPAFRERFAVISLLWVKHLSFCKEKGFLHLKNNTSCRMAHQIYDGKTKDVIDMVLNEESGESRVEPAVVQIISQESNEWQQAFSSVVFQFLLDLYTVESSHLHYISYQVNKELDDGFIPKIFI